MSMEKIMNKNVVTRKQLNAILCSNTARKIEAMRLEYDVEKYAVIPSDSETGGSNCNFRHNLYEGGDIMSLSGFKASFTKEFVDHVESMAGEFLSLEAMDKIDQLLADGFSYSRKWKKEINLGYHTLIPMGEYSGHFPIMTILEFSRGKESQHIICAGYERSINMSYKALLRKQEWIETHNKPQWVDDARVFAEETGYEERDCMVLFRAMYRDRQWCNNDESVIIGEPELIQADAVDYIKDIQTFIRGLADSRSWYKSGDWYDIEHEINYCGKGRTRDAFLHVMDTYKDEDMFILRNFGNMYYADNIAIWQRFTLERAREVVREHLESIADYRAFVESLPEKNIGRVSHVLHMDKEIIRFISLEGDSKDMKRFLTNSDNAAGNYFGCPKPVAYIALKCAEKALIKGDYNYWFSRQDIMPVAGKIHQAEHLSDTEKKEILAAYIYDVVKRGRNGALSWKATLGYMLQTENADSILAFIKKDEEFWNDKDGRFQNATEYFRERISRCIASVHADSTMEIVVEALNKEFNDAVFVKRLEEVDDWYNFRIDGCDLCIHLTTEAVQVIEQAKKKSLDKMKAILEDVIDKGFDHKLRFYESFNYNERYEVRYHEYYRHDHGQGVEIDLFGDFEMLKLVVSTNEEQVNALSESYNAFIKKLENMPV